MTDDLFFIRKIADALRSGDRERSLQDAFLRVQSMGTHKRYRRGRKQFMDFLQAVRERDEIVLVVERGCEEVGTMRIEATGGAGRLTGIVPGHYSLCLSTGQLLWEGEIYAADVIWSKAFPGQPLALAADTEDMEKPPSRTEALVHGLTMSLFPGVEAGEIVIRLNEMGTAHNEQ